MLLIRKNTHPMENRAKNIIVIVILSFGSVQRAYAWVLYVKGSIFEQNFRLIEFSIYSRSAHKYQQPN